MGKFIETQGMVKHNNSLPNAHFKKKWQSMVNNWFNQAGRKNRARRIRLEKINICVLRPYVSCQTTKYNSKKRIGRGFTLEELKMACISPSLAYRIGIATDYRRKNRSEESLKANVARLKDYRSRLTNFSLINNNNFEKKEKSYCIVKKPVVSLIHNIICNTHNILKEKSLKNSNHLTKAMAYTTHRLVLAKTRPVELNKKHK